MRFGTALDAHRSVEHKEHLQVEVHTVQEWRRGHVLHVEPRHEVKDVLGIPQLLVAVSDEVPLVPASDIRSIAKGTPEISHLRLRVELEHPVRAIQHPHMDHTRHRAETGPSGRK